jgi:hypothetical protein
MGEYVMNSPMIAIPMGGADVVLGIQWLQSLGTVAFKVQELFMKFLLEGKEIELRGIIGKPGNVISSNGMTKLLKKGHQGIIAQLCSLDVQTSKPSIPQDLQRFIDKHSKVFEDIPKGLPPTRNHDHEIIYKKGKQNVVADALSRKDEDVEAFLCAISIIQPDWIIEARDEWKNDEKVWTLIQRLQQDSSASDTFTWKNDSLWYKDRLYLCKNSQLKQKVLFELHTSPVGGHSRFLKTYHRVKKDFFWDGLKTNVQRFVVECVVFQQNKVETIKTPGLLQPLSIPS